ncbi:MAG: DUF4173 domain-containing protein [Lentisphaeria bacterium]|nr:DUF4173 domain-containing protein [Lentisphaeria bacterium]
MVSEPCRRWLARSVAALVVLTVLLVVLADWLFYCRELGWTLGLYALLVGAGIRLRASRPLTRSGALIGLAWLGLVVGLVLDPTPLTVLLALVGLALLSALGSCALGDRAADWAQKGAALVLLGWAQLPHDAILLLRRRRQGRLTRAAGSLAAAWGIPLVLSLVFLILFAVANPVIGRWLEHLGDWCMRFFQGDMLPDVGRVVFWAVMAVAVWGLLRNRSRRAGSRLAALFPGPGGAQPPPLPPGEDAWAFGSGAATAVGASEAALAVRSLSLFNALFLLQNALDIRYLWGGAALPDGMTYARYAHRGAYPLVVTALLAAVFVLAVFRTGAEGTRWQTARRLVFLWLGQNVFLTLSAAFRLYLYVGAYSLTRLRLAAGLWMFLVGLGLVFIGWRILRRRDNDWLVKVNLATLVGLLYVCCFANIDGRIAWYNVLHCEEIARGGPVLDLGYIRRLGSDALPALDWYRAGTVGEPRVRAEALLDSLRERLWCHRDDWRGWTLQRHRLARGFPAIGASPGDQHGEP